MTRVAAAALLAALAGCAFTVHDPEDHTAVLAKCYTAVFQSFCAVPENQGKAVAGRAPVEIVSGALGGALVQTGSKTISTSTTNTTITAPAPTPSGKAKK